MQSVKLLRKNISCIIDDINPETEIQDLTEKLRSSLAISLNDNIKSIVESTCEVKEVKTSKQLLKHLELKHGLSIEKTEENLVINLIEEIGYYKFSGYRKPFLVYSGLEGREWQGKYQEKVNYKDIINLINLDREISAILFNKLKTIEKRLKQRGAFFVCDHFQSSIPHLLSSNFESNRKWIEYLNENYSSILNNGIQINDLAVIHHVNNYEGKLPIWIFFEKLSFGAFQHFFVLLKKTDRNIIREDIYNSNLFHNNISDYLPNSRYNDMVTIVRMIRNKIMHYSRIYDVEYIYKPPQSIDEKQFEKICNFIYGSSSDRTRGIIRLYGITNIMSFFLSSEDYHNMISDLDKTITLHLHEIQRPFANHIIQIMNWPID